MIVTIIGGGGLLGSRLTPTLIERGHDVIVASRSPEQAREFGVKAVEADIETGRGLAEATLDSDVVVHLASNPKRPLQVDVGGTRRLLDQIGHRHLVYLSIVGVDRHPYPYYRAKHQAEVLIEEAEGLHTIVRATQFHDLIAHRLKRMTRFPMAFIPRGYVYQPIDAAEVASEIANLVETRPQGMAPDLGGPEVLDMEHLARSYMTARGLERPLLQYPKLGRSARAFRRGVHTNPDRAVGTLTWEEYLAGRFGGS